MGVASVVSRDSYALPCCVTKAYPHLGEDADARWQCNSALLLVELDAAEPEGVGPEPLNVQGLLECRLGFGRGLWRRCTGRGDMVCGGEFAGGADDALRRARGNLCGGIGLSISRKA